MEVRPGLGMDGDDVGAGFSERLEEASTGEIIRWTSNGFFVCGRSALTTAGPMVMLGTKWPSMTSTWMQSAPAFHRAHFLAKLGEVGRQDRRRDDGHET